MTIERTSYSADTSVSPGEGQHSSATREGDSDGVRTYRDEDASVSDAGREGYRRRESFLKRKKRKKQA